MIIRSAAPLQLAQQLAVNGMVPVYHKAGRFTRMIDTVMPDGNRRSNFDPSSFTHDFQVPLERIVARIGKDAGGSFQNAVIEGNGHSFDIVRVENERLVIGNQSLPNWMY